MREEGEGESLVDFVAATPPQHLTPSTSPSPPHHLTTISPSTSPPPPSSSTPHPPPPPHLLELHDGSLIELILHDLTRRDQFLELALVVAKKHTCGGCCERLGGWFGRRWTPAETVGGRHGGPAGSQWGQS